MAQEIASEISRDTGHRVDVEKLDLASLDSVRECAKTLLAKEDKIDILINNAGKEMDYKNNTVRFVIVRIIQILKYERKCEYFQE